MERPVVVVDRIPSEVVRGPNGPLTRCPDDAVPDGALAFVPVRSQCDRYARIVCPCGCRSVWSLKIWAEGDPDPDPGAGPSWTWDGSVDAPTLSPSVDLKRGCGWHGYLRAGVWIG